MLLLLCKQLVFRIGNIKRYKPIHRWNCTLNCNFKSISTRARNFQNNQTRIYYFWTIPILASVGIFSFEYQTNICEQKRTHTIGERVTLQELNERYVVLDFLKHGDASSDESTSFTDIPERYHLGTGSFGAVVKAKDSSGKMFAIKIVGKDLMTEQSFRQETKALRESRIHPYITELVEVLDCDETNSWYLVSEYCQGGELLDLLISTGPYDESSGQKLVYNVVSALNHIHSRRMAHMDVKPENLLFKTKANPGEKPPAEDVRLIDFGMAVDMKESTSVSGTMVHNKTGTTAYWAPELAKYHELPNNKQKLLKSDPRACDMWCLGLIVYISLLGCHPFDRSGDATEDQIVKRSLLGSKKPHEAEVAGQKPRFSMDLYTDFGLSDLAKDFITKCLDPNPVTRMTAKQALKHPWLQDIHHSATSHEVSPMQWEAISSALLLASMLRMQSTRAQSTNDAFLKLAYEVLDTGLVSVVNLPRVASANKNITSEPLVPKMPFEEFKGLASELSGGKRYQDGEIVFSNGDPTNGLFLIMDGNVQIEYSSLTNEKHVVATLSPGDIFGETAVLDGRPTRNATVRCVGDVQLVQWSSQDFLDLLEHNETIKREIERHIRRRQQRRAKSVIEYLVPQSAEKIDLKAGESLYREGDQAEHLFVVSDGDLESFVDLEVEGSDISIPIRRYHKDDLVGVDSVNKGRRPFGVKCLSECEVLAIPRRKLQKILPSEPSLYQNLLRFARRDEESKIEVLQATSETEIPVEAHIDANEEYKTINLEQGDIVCQRGTNAKAVYHIISGYVTVFAQDVNRPGRDVAVRRLGPGSSFGDNALLADAKWDFTVAVSSKNAQIARIPVKGHNNTLSHRYASRSSIVHFLSDKTRGMVRSDSGHQH